MRVELTTFGYWFRFLGLRTNALPLRHTDQKPPSFRGQAVVCSHECLRVCDSLEDGFQSTSAVHVHACNVSVFVAAKFHGDDCAAASGSENVSLCFGLLFGDCVFHDALFYALLIEQIYNTFLTFSIRFLYFN